MACKIVQFMPFIDEIMVHDLPWVKTTHKPASAGLLALIEKIRSMNFDAAVIFTVYSQSALPAAMTAWMAGIPRRLAYSRENPYALLTHWVCEKEPYSFIQHQVERDLRLVESIGATIDDNHLDFEVDHDDFLSAKASLKQNGIQLPKEYILFHPGVSEEKRKYPEEYWVQLGKQVLSREISIVFTGTKNEEQLVAKIIKNIGANIVNTAGLLDTAQYIALIKAAKLVVSVNTATIHIAAATQTPVVVLYALTNPQHTPWKVNARVYPFSPKESLRSRNEVVRYVADSYFKNNIPIPKPEEISSGIFQLLSENDIEQHVNVNELIESYIHHL